MHSSKSENKRINLRKTKELNTQMAEKKQGKAQQGKALSLDLVQSTQGYLYDVLQALPHVAPNLADSRPHVFTSLRRILVNVRIFLITKSHMIN